MTNHPALLVSLTCPGCGKLFERPVSIVNAKVKLGQVSVCGRPCRNKLRRRTPAEHTEKWSTTTTDSLGRRIHINASSALCVLDGVAVCDHAACSQCSILCGPEHEMKELVDGLCDWCRR